MTSIAARLIWRHDEWRHGRLARPVLAAPPIVPRDDGVILFSMIGHRVLLPYLVAVTSLHRWLRRGRVVLVDDGTLTAADHAILARQLGDPRIVPIASIDTGPCPRGGTWERLLLLLDLRAGDYVIQLDSDTVTCGPLPEVEAAIAAGRSFSLRGEAEAALLGVRDFVAAQPPLSPPLHIQRAAERVMDRLAIPGIAAMRYFRGCSGFAGFAPSGAGRALAEAFSVANQALLGDRWADWGTEQVTSSFVVANTADPLLLPYDRYLNHWGDPLGPDPRLVHFIGSRRFTGKAYATATRTALTPNSPQPRRRTSASSSASVSLANVSSQDP